MNRRRFLVELGRLITFVSEEDKGNILSLYDSHFEAVTDETVLLGILVSPSRQAVNLAHRYRREARYKQTESVCGIPRDVIDMMDSLRCQAECQGLLIQM